MPAPSPLERAAAGEAAPRGTSAAPAPVKRPHVCFVAPTTWPILAGSQDIPVVGGAEVQQAIISQALARRGYRVSMVCLDYGQPDAVEVNGVTVYKTHRPDAGLPVLRFLHPRLTSLWSTLRRVDADVYYQRTAAVTTAYVAEFCRRHGKRSIYAGASDVDFVPGKQDIHYARDRRIFEWGIRRAQRIVAQNAVQQRTLRENYGLGSIVIPNCYAPRDAAGAPDRAGYVLWVATVRPSKRPEILLEIARRMPDRRFVMIGGSDPGRRGEEYFASIREAAAQVPNVEFRGFMPFEAADRCFQGARVMLNTSLYEGFPNTFLQSWSRGVPTLAFVDTGSREDGQPVYDIAADLDDAAARLDRLMHDDLYWAQASRRVQSHFHHAHSVEAVLDRYEREVFEWRPQR